MGVITELNVRGTCIPEIKIEVIFVSLIELDLGG